MSDLSQPWLCDITESPVGTDTMVVGLPPCACQGCRAAARIEALEAALREIAVLGDELCEKIARAALAEGQDK